MDNNFVNIFLRIRPPQIFEIASPMKSFIDYDKSSEKMLVLENNPLCFDKIFYKNSTQQNVYGECLERNINNLLAGYNSSVLAYGQSGSVNINSYIF